MINTDRTCKVFKGQDWISCDFDSLKGGDIF